MLLLGDCISLQIGNQTSEWLSNVLWIHSQIIRSLETGLARMPSLNGIFHMGQCHTYKDWMNRFLLLERKH
ncbi:MAG: hypothetical protein CMB25_05850 [Euryarchaeota archaeon]|nr:hypothetical protein [Euryarchaeota archaeon]